nr:hypothetical protein [Bacteroidaceae bacterium]
RVLLMLAFLSAATMFGQTRTTVSVDKIWDEGTHAAFTSLVKFNGKYYCAFREGYSHIFDAEGRAEGKVRILESRNERKWRSVAYFGQEGIDLRDPKLSIMPDGRLMVTIGGSVYRQKKHVNSVPMVCFSRDGRNYSAPQPIEIDPQAKTTHDWVWRVTWHEGVGYGVSYSSSRRDTLALLSTRDGIRYDLVTKIGINGFPNETTLRFTSDGRMLMMVRRDAADGQGYWAVSRPPYTEWQWQPMGFRIGGQDFLVSDSEDILLATRTYFNPGHCKTALFKGTTQGDWQEIYVLPSDGDTSYPGLLIEGDKLWVSYYASTKQTGKAAIYLAKLPLALFRRP